MKLHPVINSRTALVLGCGAALTASIVTFGAKADEWDKKTILTVNQPIQVRDTLLEPGQYVFKLVNSNSDRHIVQIFNADQSHIINTVLAIPKQRMEPTGDSQFTFYETPSGTARALRAWFYRGDTVGQEFPYPRHLKEVALLEPPPPAPAPEPTRVQPVQPAPASQPQSMTKEPTTGEPPKDTQPLETAQSTPPPASLQPPPAAAPTDGQADRQQPEELPKTASPYPLIGLSGLVLLGLSGLLRLKRSA
jgi:LPXTG-motif cell wall-anchored protein